MTARQLVSGYVSRSVDAEAVRAALADGLRVGVKDVVADDDAETDPVAFVEVLGEEGEFPTRVSAFVDAARAPGFTSKPQLLAQLAHNLDAAVLYDDGASQSPNRWVRVDPDGARFEVFEDPSADALRIDPSLGTRRLESE